MKILTAALLILGSLQEKMDRMSLNNQSLPINFDSLVIACGRSNRRACKVASVSLNVGVRAVIKKFLS